MKLTDIHFKSFRSLIDQKLPISHHCIALVGLNEAGKSNILDGIRTISDDYECKIRDVSQIDESFPKIIFTYEIEVGDESEIYSEISDWFEKNTNINIGDCFGNTKRIIDRFVVTKGLNADETSVSSVETVFHAKLNSGLSMLRSTKRDSAETISVAGQEVICSSTQIVKTIDIDESSKEFFLPLNTSLLVNLLWIPVLRKIYHKNVPDVIYWEYDAKHLIPKEITYEDFLKDDEPVINCRPLYNVFLLAEELSITDEISLKKKVDKWKEDSSLRKKDEKILSRALNQHIKNIWKEYDQDLDISLEESKITVHICDSQNAKPSYYDMTQRSQGFQSFVSFLLTISAETRVEMLNNYMLILDEPEAHLHPSGVRFMRDELLKLSENNYVIFATHSIFMIDRKEIGRHIIVRKTDEKSTITTARKNNITQEAVLYEAMGTSMDEFSIGVKNVLFEGDLDLFIFDFYNSTLLSDYQKYSESKGFFLRNGGGTGDIEGFFSSKIIPQHSEWILILDCDSPGRKLRDNLKKNHPDIGMKFFFYGEDGIELEDLLPRDVIESSLRNSLETKGIKTQCILTQGIPIMTQIKEFIHKHYQSELESDKLSRKFIADFKDACSLNIKADIESFKHAFPKIKVERKKRQDAFEERYPEYVRFFNRLR